MATIRSDRLAIDVLAQVFRYQEHGWQKWFEIFCECRGCHRPTVFLVSLKSRPDSIDKFNNVNALVHFQDSLNEYVEIERFISVRDNAPIEPPEHLPRNIESPFAEGAACLSIGCHNAAATMFRLTVDLATQPFLPDPNDSARPQPNPKQRRDLGLRLRWMFDNEILPSALRELAKCIREDGNDGAHASTLTKGDAEDLLDFTTALFERLITEPKKLQLAEQRRAERRLL